MTRSRRHKVAPFVEPDLPITPMLDMSFQLLAFFLMTFNPTPTEGHLDVILPDQKGDSNATATPDPFRDPQQEMIVHVEADDKGDVGSITVFQSKEDANGYQITTKGREGRQALFRHLQKMLGEAKAEHADRMKKTGENTPFVPAKIKLELADELAFKVVIAIMDETNRAGYPAVAPALKKEDAKK